MPVTHSGRGRLNFRVAILDFGGGDRAPNPIFRKTKRGNYMNHNRGKLSLTLTAFTVVGLGTASNANAAPTLLNRSILLFFRQLNLLRTVYNCKDIDLI